MENILPFWENILPFWKNILPFWKIFFHFKKYSPSLENIFSKKRRSIFQIEIFKFSALLVLGHFESFWDMSKNEGLQIFVIMVLNTKRKDLGRSRLSLIFELVEVGPISVFRQKCSSGKVVNFFFE
jgi:hypothetical protein